MFGDDKHWTMLAVELRVQNAITQSSDGEHYNVTFRIEFDSQRCKSRIWDVEVSRK